MFLNGTDSLNIIFLLYFMGTRWKNVGKNRQGNIGLGRFGNVNVAMELMVMYNNGHVQKWPGIFGHGKKSMEMVIYKFSVLPSKKT